MPLDKHSWELAFSENLQLITSLKQLPAKLPFKKIKMSVNMAFVCTHGDKLQSPSAGLELCLISGTGSAQGISGALLLHTFLLPSERGCSKDLCSFCLVKVSQIPQKISKAWAGSPV